MSPGFEPCLADGVKFAAFRNVAMTVWVQKTIGVTVALAKLDELMAHVSAQHPGDVVLVVLITEGHPLPTRKGRKELEDFYARWLGTLRAVVFVAEGNDLWSVTARAVMAALRLAHPRRYPTGICADTREGAEWGARYVFTPDGETPADGVTAFLAAIEGLRRLPL